MNNILPNQTQPIRMMMRLNRL